MDRAALSGSGLAMDRGAPVYPAPAPVLPARRRPPAHAPADAQQKRRPRATLETYSSEEGEVEPPPWQGQIKSELSDQIADQIFQMKIFRLCSCPVCLL